MGATCSPSRACLYVANFEEKHIYNATSPFYENITIWSRYIDDIFFVWSGDESSLLEFIDWLNLGDTNLRFTSSINKHQCDFLRH